MDSQSSSPPHPQPQWSPGAEGLGHFNHRLAPLKWQYIAGHNWQIIRTTAMMACYHNINSFLPCFQTLVYSIQSTYKSPLVTSTIMLIFNYMYNAHFILNKCLSLTNLSCQTPKKQCIPSQRDICMKHTPSSLIPFGVVFKATRKLTSFKEG